MNHQTRIGRYLLALMLAAGALMALFEIDHLWSASVDFAHHYALVFRLSEEWSLGGNDPSLGEMNFYPRLSHLLAVGVGYLVGSPLLGLHLTALASVVLLWTAVVCIFHTARRGEAVAACIALAVFMGANYLWLGAPLHGAEISSNYFYSQLVAQALAMGVIALALWREMRGRPVQGVLCIALAIPPMVSTHLLPALELLGMLGVLLAFKLAPPYRCARRAWRLALAAFGLFGAAAAAVFLHPGFGAMRYISKNEGQLLLAPFDGAMAMPLLAGVVLLAALGMLFWAWRAQRTGAPAPAMAYLGAYGSALGVMCLLQLLLLGFGDGSAYAVKKYAFGLASFLIIALSLVVGRLVAVPSGWSTRPAQVLLLTAAVPLYFSLSAPHERKLDVSNLVAIEHQLGQLKQTSLVPPPAGMSDVVIDLPGQPMTVNYMFSIAFAHTPRSFGEDTLSRDRLEHIAQYSSIISARHGSRFKDRSCDRGAAGSLLVSDAACVARALKAASVCRGTYDFAASGNVDPAMITGFSEGERFSRWTAAREATFSCTVGTQIRRVVLELAPFLHGPLKQQRIEVAVNGQPVAALAMTRPGQVEQLPIVLPALAPGSKLTLTLTMPDAATPKSLGAGDDGRQLGVNLRSMTFE